MSVYSEIECDYGNLEMIADEFWDDNHIDARIEDELQMQVGDEYPNIHNIDTGANIYYAAEKEILNEGDLNSSNKKRIEGKGKGKKTKTGKENDYLNECDIQENIETEVSRNSNDTQNNKTEKEYFNNTDKTEETNTTKDKKLNIVNTDEDKIEGKTDQTTTEYNLNDAVIVRYFSRNKWTYYIGFIENIVKKHDDTYYTINFLRTIKRPNISFVLPKTKIKDRDEVTEVLIIKKVELERSNENDREYFLLDENNKIYFSL